MQCPNVHTFISYFNLRVSTISTTISPPKNPKKGKFDSIASDPCMHSKAVGALPRLNTCIGFAFRLR